jgi:hypothetical protein
MCAQYNKFFKAILATKSLAPLLQELKATTSGR